MTDAEPGPDWWLASDGRWYPPPRPPSPPPPPPGDRIGVRRDPNAGLPTESSEVAPEVEGSPLGGSGGAVDIPDRRDPPTRTLIAIAIAAVLAVGAIVVFTTGGDDGPEAADGTAGETPTAESDVGRLDPFPADAELDADDLVEPADAAALSVVDQGFRIVIDEDDPENPQLTYGVIVENPNGAGLVATSVTVQATFFDGTDSVVDTEDAFISVILPEARAAIGGIVFDPPAEVARMEVAARASQFTRVEEIDGALTITDVNTVRQEFGGMKTTFLLESSFPDDQEGIQVSAIYRDPAGAIIGGYFSSIEFVAGGDRTGGEIEMFVELPEDTVVEVSANLGFSFTFPD